jgi:hypothetical protein
MEALADVEADRLGEARRLVEPRGDVAPRFARRQLGKDDQGFGAAAELAVGRPVEDAQAAGSSSSCSEKLSGRSG